MSKAGHQQIDPRDAGLRGLELRQPVFGDDALTRAEQTLKALSGSMRQWLDADVVRMQDARLAAEQAAWSYDSLDVLMTSAHDLKGMGATYGFPLVTYLAASLCRLIETDDGKAITQRSPALACAHIDAIRASVRDDVRSERHPVAGRMLLALEAEVEKLGVAPR